MPGKCLDTSVWEVLITFEALLAGARKLGMTISTNQLESFRIHHQLVTTWNHRLNLTAATALEDAETRHFLDSLTVSKAFSSGLCDPIRLLDLGSGGGFPGIPLKVVFPSLRLALLDSMARKTAFLGYLCSALDLTDVDVYTGRAEELAHTPLRETFDAVVSRGVAPLNVLAELALPFCRVGGVMVAMKQKRIDDEAHLAKAAIATLGGEIECILPITVPELGRTRTLVVIVKAKPTPQRYPRRAGMPAKRPL